MQPNNTNTFSLVHLTRPPKVAPPAGEKPPLLLLLHGVGSNERDLFGLASYLDDRFFVVSARAPRPHNNGFGWYPVTFTAEGAIADETKAAQSRDILATFIDEVVAAYDVDPNQVYLTGFSQGAIMSLYLSLHAPEKVAGVVAMSGRLLSVTLAERASDAALTGLPIFAVHGIYDSVLPISDGRRIQEELSRLPVDFSYREYPMAHEVSQESLADIAAFLSDRLNKTSTKS